MRRNPGATGFRQGMKMRGLKYATLCLAVLGLTATLSYSADWSFFYQNDTLPLKERYYIDKRSIHTTPEGTILVWRKSVSISNTIPRIWIEELREVDCSRHRFKVLQGTVWRPSYRTIEPDDWYYFTSDDMSLAFFETVCGEGKK